MRKYKLLVHLGSNELEFWHEFHQPSSEMAIEAAERMMLTIPASDADLYERREDVWYYVGRVCVLTSRESTFKTTEHGA